MTDHPTVQLSTKEYFFSLTTHKIKEIFKFSVDIRKLKKLAFEQHFKFRLRGTTCDERLLLRIYMAFFSVQRYSDVPGKSVNLVWSL